jgi:uncharacterized damage-inducible protein DinB
MSTSWTAPPVDRPEPDLIAPERLALEQWLDYHRDTLLTKCAGLTGDQLCERSNPPSSLSLLGLVQHMTVVERWWFRMHGAGEQLPWLYFTEERPNDDFDATDPAAADTVLATYRSEIEAAKAAVADKDLDLVVPSRGDHPERTRDIRWIFIHMIEEYARHNGHADLLRERIDGTVGE